MGETLLGPTLHRVRHATHRSVASCRGIVRGEEIWCQGYSEPNAGSDLANVQTRARLEGDEWVIDGQKVWTSWAAWADWCFVLCRTDPTSKRHAGLSYLLVPMRQPGVESARSSRSPATPEFFEVFFDGARTARENVVGAPGDGWKVAMGTLAFERGVSTLGQQMLLPQRARARSSRSRARTARREDPLIRQRIADAWIGLEILRCNALRTLSSDAPSSRGAGDDPQALLGDLAPEASASSRWTCSAPRPRSPRAARTS